ncbi:MAG: 5-formyltetrahydrofolate cyclo-ligase [Rhodobiaceae bacterium]|nr:5-formyltetrahydrofolate cyclo-ligase [Rhodobiaceae bacterium]MCC0040987.1 5-formyltetrahydrofolate cyclo-ligase [Rhodobiaceae bacterium]
MTPTPDLAARKAAQRASALARRDGLYAGWRANASRVACRTLVDVLSGVPALRPVSAFLASRSEIDPAMAVRDLRRRGHRVGMPVVTGRGQPLVFRRLRAGDSLVKGVFGIAVPPETAPRVEPEVFIVPLAAFDRRGYRIGYGGGFYDRTLERARLRRQVLAIGFAFACQEIGEVVRESFDQPLDLIVTERGVIECRRGR